MSSPLLSCSTSSGMPDTREDMTGIPMPMASISATGMPSRSPFAASMQGRTNMEACEVSSRSSSGRSAPRISTRPRRPRLEIRDRYLSSSEPSVSAPAMTHFQSERLEARISQASTRTGSPFFSASPLAVQ